MIKTTNLYITPYYDNISYNYYHILTLNNIPNGPLQNFVKSMNIENPSSKSTLGNKSYCSYVIDSSLLSSLSFNNTFKICLVENISELYDYLINNNYSFNNDLNKIYTKNQFLSNNESNKLAFTFSYSE
tara:strand:- start:71 stop:457 length:387 start_codon:yes stop_codon:yes gene_type:complete